MLEPQNPDDVSPYQPAGGLQGKSAKNNDVPVTIAAPRHSEPFGDPPFVVVRQILDDGTEHRPAYELLQGLKFEPGLFMERRRETVETARLQGAGCRRD